MTGSYIGPSPSDVTSSSTESNEHYGFAPFRVEKITGVKPLQQTLGGDVRDVPETLEAALYGPASVGQPMLKTYAVIDAGKVFGLRERLEASGLPHRCLFTGKGADHYGDVAPWLVELDRGSAFARALFQFDPDSASPHHMWELNPGIFIRSPSTLDELFTHFRKFTKVMDTNGDWFFFRFWESVTWDALVSIKSTAPEITAQLLGPHTVLFRSVTSFADGTFVMVRGHG